MLHAFRFFSFRIAENTEDILTDFITRLELSPETNNVTRVFSSEEVTYTGLKVPTAPFSFYFGDCLISANGPLNISPIYTNPDSSYTSSRELNSNPPMDED